MDVEFLNHLIVKLDIVSKKNEILSSYNTIFEDDKLVSIDLIGVGITYLPNDIFNPFRFLQKLFLSHNSMKIIPKDIFKEMKTLEHIDLRGTGLNSLHPEIFSSQFKLKRLELNDNQIEVLPEGIFDNLYSLEELNLSNNRIKELSDKMFDNLGHLHKLYLYFNPMPEDLANGDYYDRDSVLECIELIGNQFH